MTEQNPEYAGAYSVMIVYFPGLLVTAFAKLCFRRASVQSAKP